jgi:predicted MFS family arabinose efflux permease
MICGNVVPRFGRKRLTSLTVLVVGFLTFLYSNASHHYVSIFVNLSISFLLAFWSASSRDLVLAQVPEYSGAMMSLNAGSMRLGQTLGTAIGGFVLTIGGYSLLGIVLGIAGIIAFLVTFFFAKDPVQMLTS